MARLIQHFSAVFSFGLALDEKIAAGRTDGDAAATLGKARELIDRAKAAAQADGRRPEQVEQASFAVVAWVDEIMARNPMFLTGVTPLQVTYFNTNNAGNEFFQHLSALKSEQDEVREVYYHVMLLGFVGQYYYETGDTGELGKLKELHSRQLPIAPAPTHTLREERITPQPYQLADPGGPRYPKQWERQIVRAGLVVALLIPLGYLLWILFAGPRQTGPSVRELVEAHIAGYPCADLVAQVGEDGSTRVTGHVSRADDISGVRNAISAIRGVRNPSFDVGLRIWPHCEVVATLKPFRERNLDRRYGLEVTPTTGHSDRFIEGERVIVKLVNANFDGYLYVDYYSVDGGVAHIYPNRREPGSGRVIRAGEQFNVGDIPGGWEVQPPFGQELITVIASPVPLFNEDAEEIEDAVDYLPRLRRTLEAQQGNTQVVANFLFLQTEPRER